MTKRLSMSTLGALAAALVAWLVCKLLSPAIVAILKGNASEISPMSKLLLGQYGPTFFSVMLSILFGFLLCGLCSYVNSSEDSQVARFKKALIAGSVGALVFCLATILCEYTAVAVVHKRIGGGVLVRYAIRESKDYIEWLFWFLQSAALCLPVYWSIGNRKNNWLQSAAVVLGSAVSISIIMFLMRAFLTIGSLATMNLSMFNVIKRYGSQGKLQYLNPEYLAYLQNFYLIYLLALGLCLGVLFSMIPTVAKKGWLVLMNGGQNAKGWAVTDPNMAIGSDPMCCIQCNPINEFASCHARIHCYGSDFVINDLGSPAGTYVNGAKVKKAHLSHGDKIRLGGHLFEFTTTEPEPGVFSKGNVQKVGSTVPSLAPLRVPSMACLVDSFGNRHLMAMGTHSIGRDCSCAVCLSWEPSVSSHHADIIIDSDTYKIADRNSSNGTKVNGVAVSSPSLLAPGDVLELGAARLRFETEPAKVKTAF